MIFIDSNVLIDVTSGDPRWAAWSIEQIRTLSEGHVVVINEVVVAEVAPSLGSIGAFRDEMDRISVVHETLTQEAAFCAGLAFRQYRINRKAEKDTSKSIIADFLIGGHAQLLGATLLTRDPRFYRAYFPLVPLITPDKAD